MHMAERLKATDILNKYQKPSGFPRKRTFGFLMFLGVKNVTSGMK